MLLFAHRGDTVNHKENTLKAFRSAVEKGADGVEMDVHVIDNTPVIVHHYVRTTNEQYPTLDEVLAEFSGKTRLEIEIKSFRVEDVQTICEVIRSHNLKEAGVTSSIYPALIHVRKYLPNAELGAIFPDKFIEDWMPEEFIIELIDGYMKLTTATVVHLPPSLYSKKVIDSLKKLHVVHHHLTSDNKEAYKRLVDLGVDRATFDDIRLLEAL